MKFGFGRRLTTCWRRDRKCKCQICDSHLVHPQPPIRWSRFSPSMLNQARSSSVMACAGNVHRPARSCVRVTTLAWVQQGMLELALLIVVRHYLRESKLPTPFVPGTDRKQKLSAKAKNRLRVICSIEIGSSTHLILKRSPCVHRA